MSPAPRSQLLTELVSCEGAREHGGATDLDVVQDTLDRIRNRLKLVTF
jgi:hypothetical protein